MEAPVITFEEKHTYYERVKFRNFQASCRLEGINVEVPTGSLEDLLKKYSRHKPTEEL